MSFLLQDIFEYFLNFDYLNWAEESETFADEPPSLEGSLDLNSEDALKRNNMSTVDDGNKETTAEILEEDPFTEKRPFQRI